MKSYNGYSPTQRMQAFNWLKYEMQVGRRKQPCKCEVCGQTKGKIMYHSEDYSEPFGDHIGAYELCFTCHMMIHCRFRNPSIWKQYIELIKNGLQVQDVNNWFQFKRKFLDKKYSPDATMTGTGNYQILIDIDEKNIRSNQYDNP